jgi:hypothetical protein
MKSKISITRIAITVIGAIAAVFIAHYEDFLPYSWQTYVAPDGTFSIELPGKAAVETKQVPLEGGSFATLHLINAAATSNRAYTCSFVDFNKADQRSPDQILESARDGSLRKVEGTLLTQNQFALRGFPGLQFQAHARGNSVMDSRIVLVDKRLYMITAVASSGRAEPKVVQRMFDSFKLNPK